MITEIFGAVASLASSLGVKDINELPGCWEHQVDEHWWIALNGHDDPTECSQGTSIPPYSALVMFNGWPAGIIDPGGGIIAAGAVANEDSFIAALRRAIPTTEDDHGQR